MTTTTIPPIGRPSTMPPATHKFRPESRADCRPNTRGTQVVIVSCQLSAISFQLGFRNSHTECVANRAKEVYGIQRAAWILLMLEEGVAFEAIGDAALDAGSDLLDVFGCVAR